MRTILFYFLQVIVTSGILYSYYHIALRNKKFHRYNRFYLLAATVASITIPLVNIPVYFSSADTESSFVLETLTIVSSRGSSATVMAAPSLSSAFNWFSWQHITALLYGVIAFIIVVRVIFSLLKIRRIIKNNPVEELDNIHFVNTAEPGTPFSFFRWMFWNKKITLRSEKGEQIFRHEFFHISQKHSYDTMYMELLNVLFWLNPFFYLAKKEIKAIHEFLADQFAVSEDTKWQYAELLLMQALNTEQHLVNPFFHTQIKRRIAMLTTSQKTGHQYARKIMVLPLAAVAVALFAFSYKKAAEAKIASTDQLVSNADTSNPSGNKIIVRTDVPYTMKTLQRKSPDAALLSTWQDAKKYGVWIDNKRVSNAVLTNYKPADFSHYFVSKLEKNAVNYGNHYFQVTLMTNDFFLKSAGPLHTHYATSISAINEDTLSVRLKEFEQLLFVINGKIQPEKFTVADLKKTLSPNQIKSVTILRDKKAIEKYGQAGINGVIEINTAPTTGVVTPKLDDGWLWVVDGKIMSHEECTAIIRALQPSPRVVALKILTPAEAIKKYGYTGKKGAIDYDTKKNVPDVKGWHNYSVYSKADINPSFPGGDTAWRRYLMRNINANIPVDSGASGGTYKVIVSFIVHEDGRITDIKPVTHYGFGMEKETMRIIATGPKWVPAMQEGRKVKGRVQQPVTFVVEEEESPVKPASTVTKSTLPTITLNDLKSPNIYRILELPAGTAIISFMFAIDLANGDVVEIPNSGNQFNSKILQQLKAAAVGRIITIDQIKITVDGKEKRLPSKVYEVVN